MTELQLKPSQVGNREYVLAKLAQKKITKPYQFWRAEYNGSGIEYACSGPDYSPDTENYLKLLAVEDELEAAYMRDNDPPEVAALEREHAKLLAPILLQLRRSQHAGQKGAGSLKSLLAKAVYEAVHSHGHTNAEQILKWLKNDGSALCDYENDEFTFSDGVKSKVYSIKDINQAIRREFDETSKNV